MNEFKGSKYKAPTDSSPNYNPEYVKWLEERVKLLERHEEEVREMALNELRRIHKNTTFINDIPRR